MRQVTLLSEYQIREHGLIIDSTAKKHFSGPNVKGKQLFQVNPQVYIDFEDKGGLMKFESLPFEQDDEEKYDIITITSPEKWTLHKFQKHKHDIQLFDSTNFEPGDTKTAYPTTLDHLSGATIKGSGEDMKGEFPKAHDKHIPVMYSDHEVSCNKWDPGILDQVVKDTPIPSKGSIH